MIRLFALRSRSSLLILGLTVLSVGVILIATGSETAVVTVEQDLARYWRTTYDILVRPTGTRSPIEDQYGLVQANHLSGIPGGISIPQYEAIQKIPGVEVAAPIAMLGYLPESIPLHPFGSPGTGAYILVRKLAMDDGGRPPSFEEVGATYYYINPAAGLEYVPGLALNVNPPTGVSGHFEMPFLIAGVDPPQEAALIGLDRALAEGEFLTGKEPLPLEKTTNPFGQAITRTSVPVLINATPYISSTVRTELWQIALPPEISTLEELVARGGTKFLDSLPKRKVGVQESNSKEIYQMLVENLRRRASSFVTLYEYPVSIPSPIRYREITPPFPHEDIALEIALPDENFQNQQTVGGGALVKGERPYRTGSAVVLGDEKTRFNVSFSLYAKGTFDLERIPKPADVSRVPLETYFPPVAILRYDENGQPVEPRPLRPTLNPAGYIQSPPLLLTNLRAACTLRDNCISAIRVRVGGIDGLTPQAQRKIEAIASEIHRRTGLDVDIMVGSSPRRILVLVPGIGYVEEQWVQKNVTLSYHRRIQSGHILLIAALLVTGGLFVADMAWADLLARQPVLALQKALGWRSATLMGHVLRRALLVGAGAGLSGTALAAGALALARQPLPSLPWLAGVPLLVTALSLLGSLYPALQAARVPPIPLLRMAGLRHRPGRERVRGRSGGVLLSARYALRGVVRRWSRSLLAGMTAALSAGLLVLLVGVVVDRAGYLSGTLLGEYILVQVEGYHWWLVGVGMALAAGGMGNSLLAGVLERRREIGVLKALGWRTGAVARLFLLEGAVLGLLGGLAGTALGLAVYLGLYRSVGAGLLWAVLAGLGVPTLVGMLAAAYPARVAAAVAPAEAVRGE